MKNKVLEVLWKISKNHSHIKPSNLIERLCKATGLSITDVKAELGQLVKEGSVTGVSLKGDPLGNIRILASKPEIKRSETEEKWRSALIKRGYEGNDLHRLLKCAEYLEGMSEADMYNLLIGIEKIRENQETLFDEDPYIVSARYLLGSAKALKVIGDPFGLPFSSFRGRAAYALVAGPENPEAVLFIENVAPFEKFCSSPAVERTMAVSTYGYSLAWNNLALKLRSKDLISLPRKGRPPLIWNVIETKPLFFWGDLDQEGLNIFIQLRKVLSTLQLSALYLPMIDALTNGKSHEYGKLSDKENQRKVKSEDTEIKKLSKLCESRSVDQEFVEDLQIEKLCNKSLSLC
jgi:predicted transcriptional regulator